MEGFDESSLSTVYLLLLVLFLLALSLLLIYFFFVLLSLHSSFLGLGRLVSISRKQRIWLESLVRKGQGYLLLTPSQLQV